MDELIKKQTAIDMFKEYQPELATHVWEFGNALKNLPSVNQWIPCSERLPNKMHVHGILIWDLVCDSWGNISVGYYDPESKRWNVQYPAVESDELDSHIVAWMPLPHSYGENK